MLIGEWNTKGAALKLVPRDTRGFYLTP
jgi:hypothetical protein